MPQSKAVALDGTAMPFPWQDGLEGSNMEMNFQILGQVGCQQSPFTKVTLCKLILSHESTEQKVSKRGHCQWNYTHGIAFYEESLRICPHVRWRE